MRAVADTSPLIVLGKVGRLELFDALYGGVVLPPAVLDEVLAKADPGGAGLREFLGRADVRPVRNVQLARSLAVDLGPGESEAIALAGEVDDAILVMDDADGRRVARGLGLRVTGVLGMLIEARHRGVLPAVAPILDALADEGFWVTAPLRRAVLDAVQE